MSDKKQLPASKGQKVSLIKLATANSATGKTFVPPVLQEVGKLAAGVAAVSAGSATGNPRNKCALQPGHSLMDWIRLGSSGKDLTGVGERAGRLTITPSQLAQHDKPTDSWLAIRGKVYNVTEYLPFHPGGREELMKGVGRNATQLFDQVHPWVNYDSILQKCFVGKLALVDQGVDTEALFYGKERKTNAPKAPDGNKNKNARISTISSPLPSPSSDVAGKSSISPPRFDWIQKTDQISAIFYTKPFSNAAVEIARPDAKNSPTIFLTYGGNSFTNELAFPDEVLWPCQVKVNRETGKIEAHFTKAKSKIWESHGALRQRSESDDKPWRHRYRMTGKIRVNHNTFLMEFERADGAKVVVPLGKHVRVFGTVDGREISRSYTPVPCCLKTGLGVQNSTTSNVCLMVKRYPDGNLSRQVCDRNPGDFVEMCGSLGDFDLGNLDGRETFLMLAAGTGITPMFGVILFLLERRVRKCRHLRLLFFNKAEEDVLFGDQLENLQKSDPRFVLQTILSQPGARWKGLKGHVTKDLLEGVIRSHVDGTGYTKNDLFVMVCGPTLFTNLAHGLLSHDLQFKEEQIHLFLG